MYYVRVGLLESPRVSCSPTTGSSFYQTHSANSARYNAAAAAAVMKFET